MNVPKIIRVSAVVVGLGAALLFTSSVKAQEIENTVWSEGSNTVPLNQTASTAAASNPTPVSAHSSALNSSAQTTPSDATLQASVLQQPTKMAWIFPLAMICMAVIAVPALMRSKQTTDLNNGN